MRDPNRVHPIHPADCSCPRCDPQLGRSRESYAAEFALCGLIIAAAFAGAASVLT